MVRTVFTVKLDPELQKKIRAKAREEERNIAVVLERILRKALAEDETPQTAVESENTHAHQ